MDAKGDVIATWESSLGYHVGWGVQAAVKPASRGWQSPVQLGGPLGEGPGAEGDASLAVDHNGDAIVVWSENLWEPAPARSVVVASVMAHASGVWSPPVQLSANGGFPRAAIAPNGEVIAVWRSSDMSAGPSLQAVRGSATVPGGAWQAPEVVVAEPVREDFQVALGAGGDAALLWARPAQGETCESSLMAVTRVGGGAWRAPAQLSTSGVCVLDPRLALNAAGRAVAAWESDTTPSRTLQAAVGSTKAGTWQKPTQLVTVTRYQVRPCRDICPGRPQALPQVAVGARGNAVIVWNQPEAGVDAALMPQGSDAWGPAVGLTAAIDTYGPPVYLRGVALDARGDGIAVMGGRDAVWANVLADQRPLSDARLSRSSFPATGPGGHGSARPRSGTSLRFTLTAAAKLRVAIVRLTHGARRNWRCVPLLAHPRKKNFRRCIRKVSVGVLANREELRGTGQIRFSTGPKGRYLKPGNYEAVVSAHDRRQNSAPVALPFTVLPPRLSK